MGYFVLLSWSLFTREHVLAFDIVNLTIIRGGNVVIQAKYLNDYQVISTLEMPQLKSQYRLGYGTLVFRNRHWYQYDGDHSKGGTTRAWRLQK